MNLIKLLLILSLFGTLQAAQKKPTILHSICILGEDAESPNVQKCDGVQFFDIQVPKEKKLSQQLSLRFLNAPITPDTTARLQKTIERHYQENHHPLVKILFPKQEVTQGCLQVRVIESRLGQLSVEGNCHTSSCLLENYIDVCSNGPIDVKQLRKGVDFANRNPFRRVDMVYGPGQEKNTTDLHLLVNDRRPLRFYTGTDNTGVETTDRGRAFAGFNAARIYSLDHFMSYQYTASYDFHHFQAHTLQYIAFLSWQHIFNVYGGYSSVFANLPFPSTKNHGRSYQASGRYVIPLDPSNRLSHEWGFGFDFKRTNNTIEFLEPLPLVGPNVNLTQFVGHYAGNWIASKNRVDYQAELFYSPGQMVSDESNSDYQALRPGGKNRWVYGKAFIKYFQKLPRHLNVSLCLRGQLSSQNLLPSEQLGLGGFDTVRGYDERQLSYDSGLIFNAEMSTSSVPVISRFFNHCTWKDAFQALVFIDYGYGRNHTPIFGEKKHDYLMGMGPAVRYLIDPWLTARLDLGFKIHNEPEFTGGKAMWHFSFIGSY
jgi:hemolysin activation/secretion protein